MIKIPERRFHYNQKTGSCHTCCSCRFVLCHAGSGGNVHFTVMKAEPAMYRENSFQMKCLLQPKIIPTMTPPCIPEMWFPFLMNTERHIRSIKPRTVSGAIMTERRTAGNRRRNSRPGKVIRFCPYIIMVLIITIIPIRKAKEICSTAGNAVSGLKQVMNSTTITARDDKQGL